mmetsp:Transcript_43175/g.71328  ORF Transcript_43175/g.71328 Transcript_43175/m.71328 type:complete len:142 (-) Transcript_43175:117-542(-)
MDEFGRMMLRAAREEVEQLRETNEKLMRLHTKNHLRKPRMQDVTTQTPRWIHVGDGGSGGDGGGNMSVSASESTSMNMSFISTQSTQTQKLLDEDAHGTLQAAQFEMHMLPHSPAKSDKVLMHETSVMTAADNSSIEQILS